MEKSSAETNRTELIEYAIDVLTEALQEGYVEPVTLIECVRNATKSKVLAALRAVASLSPSDQFQVISLLQRSRVCPHANEKADLNSHLNLQ